MLGPSLAKHALCSIKIVIKVRDRPSKQWYRISHLTFVHIPGYVDFEAKLRHHRFPTSQRIMKRIELTKNAEKAIGNAV